MTHSEVRTDEALELAILEGTGDEDAPAKVREYVDSDRMIDRLRMRNALSARIVGHYGHYTVRLTVRPDGLAFSCSCPSYEYPCKHARALALTYLEAPESFVDMAGARAALERRSKAELVNDLLSCIGEHPRLLGTLGLASGADGPEFDDDDVDWEE
jgi:SWIM zinc finger